MELCCFVPLVSIIYINMLSFLGHLLLFFMTGMDALMPDEAGKLREGQHSLKIIFWLS
jgi:hypothetical protein